MFHRLRPLVLLLPFAILGLWFALGLHRTVNWHTLAANREALRDFTTAQPVLAGAAYCAVYAALIAISLPLGGLLTLVGGLLFGAVAGAVLATVAASTGATLLFLLARGLLAPLLARRAGPAAAAMREGLRRDGFSYLLAIRLIPVVPFWVGNLAPALAGMKLAPFAAATVLGIIPTTAIIASIGAGLSDALGSGVEPDFSILLSRAILLPLLGLAALSLLPVAWRRWRAARRVGP